jgi:ubiquinone/menaquinone biosynthesis C-methylase UbiE|tara:strand:- start:405 stop:1202 length:798 start_codon:yes stop_codon:yes gene_type:complete
MNYKKSFWMDKTDLSQIRTFEYWNNKDIESQKIWSIPNDDFGLLEKKFLSKGLFQQFKALTHDINFSGLTGASLASGNCILESFIIHHTNQKIDKLYCLEMSEHRIHHYAPKILHHYRINSDQVELCLGSFYGLRLENNSLDFILLSQAFHHADDPNKLLKEINRVMKDEGYIIIIGEHYFKFNIVAKRSLKYLLKFILNYKNFRNNNNLIPKWIDLFPPSIRKGDIHYSKYEYINTFKTEGFSSKRKIFRKYENQGYLLKKENN